MMFIIIYDAYDLLWHFSATARPGRTWDKRILKGMPNCRLLWSFMIIYDHLRSTGKQLYPQTLKTFTFRKVYFSGNRSKTLGFYAFLRRGYRGNSSTFLTESRNACFQIHAFLALSRKHCALYAFTSHFHFLSLIFHI